MNPDLLYKYNEYQRQDRMEEARCARLVRLTCWYIPHPVLLKLARGIIAAGQHLQAFALGGPSLHSHHISPSIGD